MAASSTAPSTPEPKLKTTGLRSFTLPTSLSAVASAFSPTQTDASTAQGIEILFVHPQGTIIKFSTNSLGSSSSNSSTRGLRWTSPTERTVAAGSLEIYRVPGSVSFLHSGELLHAILPRSQCWCVDGVSKFALRVLPDTYYRIELPASTPEELEAIEDFKNVLSKVMHYERTACPFARKNEEDDLPELEDSRNKTFSRSDKAKQWKLDRTYGWKGESGETVRLRPVGSARPPRRQSAEVASPTVVEDSPAGLDATSRSPLTISEEHEHAPSVAAASEEHGQEAESASTGVSDAAGDASIDRDCDGAAEAAEQSSTLPASSTPLVSPDLDASADEEHPALVDLPSEDGVPQQPTADALAEEPLTTATSPSVHSHDGEVPVLVEDLSSEPAPQPLEIDTSSLKDFKLLQQIPTDMPPSPPDSSAGLPVQEETTLAHTDDQTAEVPLPESAVESDEATKVDSSPTLAEPRPPPKTRDRRRSSRASSAEDPFAAIQARILARRSIGGTTSFYPPVTRESTSTSTTSVSSAMSSRSRIPIDHQRNLASALVQKACTVFLGPPAYLVAMMLRIAARFANGKFGNLYSMDGEADDGVPHSYHVRNSSNTSEEDEDDFGVSFSSPVRVAAARNLRERKATQRSEVD